MNVKKYIWRESKSDGAAEGIGYLFASAVGFIDYQFEDLPLLLEKLNISKRKFEKLTGRHPNTVKKWLVNGVPENLKEDVLTAMYSFEEGAYLLKAGSAYFRDVATGKAYKYDQNKRKFVGYSRIISNEIIDKKQIEPDRKPIFYGQRFE